MINIITVIKGHREVALEHIRNNNLPHKTTWLQSIHTTLLDLIFNKTITIDNSYIVYEVVHKRTIGIKLALIISIYVPLDKRGGDIAKRLINAIPYETVITNKGKDSEEVGRLYAINKTIH